MFHSNTVVSRMFIGASALLLAPLSVTAATDDYAPISDLAMLSIVAAQREGPANLADDSIEIAGKNALTIVETFETQQTLVAQKLQPAQNPEDAPATEESLTIEAVEITDTPMVLGASDEAEVRNVDVVIAGPASLEVVMEDILAGTEVNPDVISSMTEIVPLPVATLGRLARTSEDEPFFKMTGVTMPTTQRFYTSGGELIDELPIEESPVLGTDESGRQVLSGVCGDAYYVVLLYKGASDYAKDPDSYILNRAYPCNGVFSYPVESLPQTLPSGMYYLLIGEQGEAGDWLPITRITEIVLNRD